VNLVASYNKLAGGNAKGGNTNVSPAEEAPTEPASMNASSSSNASALQSESDGASEMPVQLIEAQKSVTEDASIAAYPLDDTNENAQTSTKSSAQPDAASPESASSESTVSSSVVDDGTAAELEPEDDSGTGHKIGGKSTVALTNNSDTNCTDLEKSAGDVQKNKEASISNAMASMGVTANHSNTSTDSNTTFEQGEKKVNGWVLNSTGVDVATSNASNASDATDSNATIVSGSNATGKNATGTAILSSNSSDSNGTEASVGANVTLSKKTEAAAANASAAKEREQEAVMQQMGMSKKQMYKQEGPEPCNNETSASNVSASKSEGEIKAEEEAKEANAGTKNVDAGTESMPIKLVEAQQDLFTAATTAAPPPPAALSQSDTEDLDFRWMTTFQ